jgi:hypothetical protein
VEAEDTKTLSHVGLLVLAGVGVMLVLIIAANMIG